MSEKQEESEDRSYIQEGDIVLANLGGRSDICKVISKFDKNNNVLYMRSLTSSYSTYERHIQYVSLLIPVESMSFQYKMENDRLLAYKDSQLVMSIHCPTYHEYNYTNHYIKQMSNIYALRQLKDTCNNEKVLELLKTIEYKYE